MDDTSMVEIRRNGHATHRQAITAETLLTCAACGDDLYVHEWLQYSEDGMREIDCDRCN